MRCRTCGVNLPAGAMNCPNCGTAVPRPDETVVDTPAQEPFVPPTVYGGPIPPAPNYNSSMQNAYDRPPLPSSPSYSNQGNQYPPSPYDPAGPNQYQPGFNNQAYQPGTFNQNQVAPNQYGPGSVPPVFPPPVPGYMPPQQAPRRKTRWGLIVGVIAGILALACIGASVLFVGGIYSLGKTVNKQATATASASTVTTPASTDTTPAANTTPASTNATPAANSNGGSPSGAAIDPNAASIVTNAQTAKGFNQVDGSPKDPTTTFKTGDQIYIVFKLNNEKVDYTTQKIYVNAELYINNTIVSKSDPLTIDKPRVGGYFAGSSSKTGQGATEIYLCYKPDCSDAKLAQVVNFTVQN